MTNSVSFGATFQKLPCKITARKMSEAFRVKNSRGKGTLEGQAGDYFVTNLLNGEQYPMGPKTLANKYEYLYDDVFKEKMDKPVYIEADFPKADKIVLRDGGKTKINDIQVIEAIGIGGIPYPIPGDYFLKAYAPIDEAGRKIVEVLKTHLRKT